MWYLNLVLFCSYSIDRSTDKNRQFRIEDYGNGTASVFVRRPLDRETDASHKVHVLATDKGTLL